MDSALKQRLLGAAVLIALAIIFVPMFLGNAPPKQDSTIQNLDIPPLPERKFETRTLTGRVRRPSAAAAPAATAVRQGRRRSTRKHRRHSRRIRRQAAADKASTPPATSGDAAEAAGNGPNRSRRSQAVAADAKPPAAREQRRAGGRFSVNLGIYADQAHANALVAKVKKLGFAAYSEATEYQGKTAQRVRVGPFADRAAAESRAPEDQAGRTESRRAA